MAPYAGACCPGGCGQTRYFTATICVEQTRNSNSLVSITISPPCSASTSLPRNATASTSFNWQFAGFSTKVSPRARHPGQLQPLDEVFGWSLDASVNDEIEQILGELIKDPVGPEFMAPPART
jgi:hypothetical protein